jgi:Asp/Glu/hydantoin racemase
MKILLLNPNSSNSVTESIDTALDGLRQASGAQIECATLAEGPPGIETQEHVDSLAVPIARRLAAEEADAYIIACFSDPGLFLAREMLSKPVVGIAESAFHLATGLGQRFGIVAILDRSIPRHLRHARALGFSERLAGDRAINVGVLGLSSRETVIDRIVSVGETLRDQDGADVLILGCAGMGRYRSELEEKLGIPVIDPCQAAVARAIGLVSLGYRRVA